MRRAGDFTRWERIPRGGAKAVSGRIRRAPRKSKRKMTQNELVFFLGMCYNWEERQQRMLLPRIRKMAKRRKAHESYAKIQGWEIKRTRTFC